MSLPRGVRPRRGQHQVGRHHPPRGQDGLPRHGPPRDRRLHRVEDARGEEGPRPHRRGLPLGLQRRGLPHRLGAELQQLRARHRRLHARGGDRRRVADPHAHQRQGVRHLPRQGPLAQGRRERLALRRPGVQYDSTINDWHTSPTPGASTRATPARSTCSSTTRPATCRRSTSRSSSARTPTARWTSTSRATATRPGCSSSRRRSSSTSRRTRRSRSRRTPTTTAPWAWATPTSAPCSCSWASPTTPTRAAPSPARSPRSSRARPTA
jgi:hypothetical protein